MSIGLHTKTSVRRTEPQRRALHAPLQARADPLARRQLQDPLVQRRAGGVPIQRTKVPVSGGEFEDPASTYVANDGFAKGADFVVSFTPTGALGSDGDTVSLIQTVQDSTKLTSATDGSDITPRATTSLLHTRQLGLGEHGATQDEVGTAIDQEVLSAPDKNGVTPQSVVNLDPRYTEQRMGGGDALNTTGKSQHPYSARSATKANGTWSKAFLNDAPAVSTRFRDPQTRQFVQHTLTGGMNFEVAALHNETNTYLGSVKWGWKMNADHAVLNPTKLTLGNAGSASDTFHKAAKKWNETKIVDPSDGTSHTPMQLPIPKKPQEDPRVHETIGRFSDKRLEEDAHKARSINFWG